ncbi:hypothetical protein BBJ28_00020645 [Nothophytophthora sp. Chile5]|nr:hypothetical protein BBJ28_00020645 [Nothophytophthora sp. Chile5]
MGAGYTLASNGGMLACVVSHSASAFGLAKTNSDDLAFPTLLSYSGVHLRRLQEPPEEPPMQPTGDDNNNEFPDNNNQPPDMGTYQQPMLSGQQLMGGQQPMGDQQPTSEDYKEQYFPGGGFRGGCFPGSFNWPRCRSFGGGRRCFPGGFDWPRCRRFGFSL